MLLAFGSVVAMGLPVITALAGLGIGIALLELLTHVLTVPNFSPEMAAMIGIGVGHRLRALHRHPIPAGHLRGP